MGKSIRGEPGAVSEEMVAEQNTRIKRVTLLMAAEVCAHGGPHVGNNIEKGIVGLAEVTGNTSEQIATAAKVLGPRFQISTPTKP